MQDCHLDTPTHPAGFPFCSQPTRDSAKSLRTCIWTPIHAHTPTLGSSISLGDPVYPPPSHTHTHQCTENPVSEHQTFTSEQQPCCDSLNSPRAQKVAKNLHMHHATDDSPPLCTDVQSALSPKQDSGMPTASVPGTPTLPDSLASKPARISSPPHLALPGVHECCARKRK